RSSGPSPLASGPLLRGPTLARSTPYAPTTDRPQRRESVREGGSMAEKRPDVAGRTESQSRPQEQGRQQGSQSERQHATESGRDQSPRMARWQPTFFASPFTLLERLADEMSSVFERAGLSDRPMRQRGAATPAGAWTPAVDVVQRDNELVIRADLPGMTAD